MHIQGAFPGGKGSRGASTGLCQHRAVPARGSAWHSALGPSSRAGAAPWCPSLVPVPAALLGWVNHTQGSASPHKGLNFLPPKSHLGCLTERIRSYYSFNSCFYNTALVFCLPSRLQMPFQRGFLWSCSWHPVSKQSQLCACCGFALAVFGKGSPASAACTERSS